MGTLEQSHQRQLLKEHRARLDVLELRAAREGYDTDPATVTEMDQIRASIARLSDALDAPLPEKTIQALSPDDRYQGHVAWQMRMEQSMYRFERDMRTMRMMLYGLCAVVLVIATVVVVR